MDTKWVLRYVIMFRYAVNLIDGIEQVDGRGKVMHAKRTKTTELKDRIRRGTDTMASFERGGTSSA